jgi:hypothetical protein
MNISYLVLVVGQYLNGVVLNLKKKLSNRNAIHEMHIRGIVCLVTLKIGKKIPKKSTGCQIFFLIIFILRTYYYIL